MLAVLHSTRRRTLSPAICFSVVEFAEIHRYEHNVGGWVPYIYVRTE